jgi:hypothetical protein
VLMAMRLSRCTDSRSRGAQANALWDWRPRYPDPGLHTPCGNALRTFTGPSARSLRPGAASGRRHPLVAHRLHST